MAASPKFPLLGLLLLLTIVSSPATVANPVCPQTDKLSRGSFPDGILWGTATASYQVEGAVDEDCRGPTMWDIYTKRHPERCNHHDGSVSVDFYHRYKEDIQLMKRMNTNSFRFSFAWSRIFPFGKMEYGVNKAGVKFYHDLIDELLANGITPLATIFHWDIPQALEDEYGGFLDRRIVKDFTDYANFTFHEYGGKVKYWLTFNEPWVYSRAGYDIGKKAPGRCSQYVHKPEAKKTCLGGQSGVEAYIVSHNLLLSHAEAVQEFRKCEKCKGGKIGIAHCPAWFEPGDLKGHSNSEASVQRVIDFIFGWHLDPTTYGDYPESMKKQVGKRLPEFTPEEKEKLKNSYDFVGFNYYTSFFAHHNEKPIEDQPSWQQDSLFDFDPKRADNVSVGSKPKTALMAVYAEGLKQLMVYLKKNYNNPEIMITENGYGEDLGELDGNLEVGINDYNRKYYLQRHILAMHEAVCEHGANLIGYFVWSLMDNFEWQDGYKSRFGLYYIDFKNNLTRHLKKSGEWYTEFLKTETKSTPFKKEEL